MLENPDSRKLVFIIGAPRSGTTWLQKLISQSPQISTSNETHLFDGYVHPAMNAWERHKSSNRSIGLSYIIDQDLFHLHLRRLCDSIFEIIHDNKMNSTIVLEKTPAHARVWMSIRKLYPEAQFIHIVRDPRSVVASLKAASKSWGRLWAPSGVVDGAYRWRQDVESAESIDSGCHRVYYETLLDQPAETLKSALSSIGVEETLENCARYCQSVESGDAWVPWDQDKEPDGFIRAKSNNTWKKDLSSSEIAAIERITSDLCLEHGYKSYFPKRRFAIRVDIYRLLNAVENLAKRYRSYL